MASFTKAALASYRLEAEGHFAQRINDERQTYDAMNAKDQKICDDKCHSLKLYFAHVSDDASLGVMLKYNVDTNFINTKNFTDKYVAKKVYELAEYLAGVTGKLDLYDLRVFRTLYNFAKAGKAGVTVDQMRAAIDHSTVPDDALIFRIAGKQAGSGTSQAQYRSSKATFIIYGMAKAVTCRDTGASLVALDLEAPATKAMIARLNLETK